MAVIRFPPIEEATPEGIVAIGGDMDVESLLLAYSQGIFPWPLGPAEQIPLAWFCPDPRGVILLKELRASKSFLKFMKKLPILKWDVRYNTAFDQVIDLCAKTHQLGPQNGTWITEELKLAYKNFHRAGYAFSVEVFDGENQLIGGLYGVRLHNYFSGESMFYLRPNASKVALYSLLLTLKAKGIAFLDTQMVTPTVAAFGGRMIRRKEFLQYIREGFYDYHQIDARN